jgi:hypothetical protein
MAKNQAKKALPLSAARLRSGWQGPVGTRIQLAPPAGRRGGQHADGHRRDGVRIIPVLRSAIEDGTATSTMLAGLSSTKNYHDDASAAFTSRPVTKP